MRVSTAFKIKARFMRSVAQGKALRKKERDEAVKQYEIVLAGEFDAEDVLAAELALDAVAIREGLREALGCAHRCSAIAAFQLRSVALTKRRTRSGFSATISLWATST